MSFASKLRAARLKRGWTQQELAVQLYQVSRGAFRPAQSAVSAWERGLRPGDTALRWLLKLLPELKNGAGDD